MTSLHLPCKKENFARLPGPLLLPCCILWLPIHPFIPRCLLTLPSPSAVPRAASHASAWLELPGCVRRCGAPGPSAAPTRRCQPAPAAWPSRRGPAGSAVLPAAPAVRRLCRAEPGTCTRLRAREVTIELRAISESDERDLEHLSETQGKSFFPKGRRVRHCFRINVPSVDLPHHRGRGTAASSFVSMFEAVSWFISATAALRGSPSPPCL